MRKLKPMTYPTKRSSDPSVALMKVVNDGKPTPKLEQWLLSSFPLNSAQVARMLRR